MLIARFIIFVSLLYSFVSCAYSQEIGFASEEKSSINSHATCANHAALQLDDKISSAEIIAKAVIMQCVDFEKMLVLASSYGMNEEEIKRQEYIVHELVSGQALITVLANRQKGR
ncbi:hypothetical protein [Methylobacterium sp. Gmos1]